MKRIFPMLCCKTCGEAWEPSHPAKERQAPPCRTDGKNHVIFYVVIGNVLEVRPILYNRRTVPEHI